MGQKAMKPAELIRAIERFGGERVRQKGSHVRMRVGECFTTVPVHARDLPAGLLRAIERDLEPCLGKGWLRK
jgi:predicted RNA binding protein YcfA (HicA-like mRNA interferase family)